MKNVGGYQFTISILVLFVIAFIPWFLANNNKITAEQATTISQTQARLVIAEELKSINNHLLQISESVAGLSATLSTYSSTTRIRN